MFQQLCSSSNMATMMCPNLFNIHPLHSHKHSVRLPFHSPKQFVNLPFHSPKQFVNLPFHSRTAFSSFAITRASEKTQFQQLASTLKMSEDDIARILRVVPELEDPEIVDGVEQFVQFLNQRGFTDAEISQIMSNRPLVLVVPMENLESKTRLLEDIGFEGETLRKLLTISPSILGVDLENSLLPTVAFLKCIFEPKDVLVRAVLKEPQLLIWDLEKILKPSFAFWEGYGLSREELVNFLCLAPAALSRTSITSDESRLIQKIGLDKRSGKFKYLLRAVCLNHMTTLKGIITSIKRWGLSYKEIWQILRAAPTVLDSSEKTIGKRMKFLVHDLKVSAKGVVKYPMLLLKNIKQSMRPRFLVWQEIESTPGLKLSILEVLSMPREKFMKVIEEHPASETLRTIYENALSHAPNAPTAQSDQAS